MKFASLCVLSYKRPTYLNRSIGSLIVNTDGDVAYELIVNEDGSDDIGITNYLTYLKSQRLVSWVIENIGRNMGVGKSFRNCIGVSSGDYIFKLDADLDYLPNWLDTIVSILDNNRDVGCCGLFNYRNYDASDERFEIIEERPDCYIVSDFVNSGYGFKRDIFESFGSELGDDGWQQFVKSRGYKLAIPKKDVVHNFGFGEERSVYVNTPTKSNLPLLFANKILK